MPVRAYRLRLYPTRAQERALAQWFGQARFAWNWALDARTKAYRRRGESKTSVALGKTFTQVRRAKAWLGDVPAAVHQQTMRDLDKAFEAFFAGRARHPRFKAKHRSGQSARVDFDRRHGGKVRAWNAGQMVLPKIGPCKLRGRDLPAAMPSLVTVKRDPTGRYWVSFCVEEAVRRAPAPGRASVGVDAGARRLATLSSAERFDHPRALHRHLAALKTQQQRLARQCKGSGRRERTRARVARIHARIADCRREHLHRVSTRIVNESQVVCVETLDVKGMTRSAKGTREAPGTGVRRQSQINRALLDASMSELLRQIRYKAGWYGRTLVEVPREYPSSQLCSACGWLEAGLRLDEYVWTCSGCGARHDRDVNAAKNIEAEGLRILKRHPEETGAVRAPGGRGEGPAGDPTRSRVSANRPHGVRGVGNPATRP